MGHAAPGARLAFNRNARSRVPTVVHSLALAASLLLTASSGAPAFADDVGLRWRLGPPDEQGARARLGLELYQPRDDQAIWFAPLPDDQLADQVPLTADEASENWTRLFPPPAFFDECNFRPRHHDLPRTLHTSIRAREVVIVDERGARAYSRATGRLRRAWRAPRVSPRWPGGDETLELLVFNRGAHKSCGDAFEPDAPPVAVVCDDVVAWFDGATIALLGLDPLTQLGRRTINPRAVRSDDRSHWLRVRIGAWSVELESPA